MIGGKWFQEPTNDLTVVFIHGINSSEDCWRNPNGAYWPELLRSESEFSSVGIYIFEYRTGIDSGYYSLGDAVDSLKEYMRLDNVINHSQIIFVCHSMGGIIVRQFLVTQQLQLLDKGLKDVGLFLVASPSLGSDYANMVSLLSRALEYTQASSLEFSQSNTWLNDLDKNFRSLKENGKLIIKGKELIEDLPIILKQSLFFKKQIVEPFSGARYFGDPLKIPKSDHFTIARPESKQAIQHRLLKEFIQALKKDRSDYLVRNTTSNLESDKPSQSKEVLPPQLLQDILLYVRNRAKHVAGKEVNSSNVVTKLRQLNLEQLPEPHKEILRGASPEKMIAIMIYSVWQLAHKENRIELDDTITIDKIVTEVKDLNVLDIS